MALTDAQMTDVRRFAGHPLSGTTLTINANQDIVYVRFGMTIMSLYTRLTTLSASEETVLTGYLTMLNTLEAAITAASSNLDTDAASVWTHNKNEVSDRTSLYNQHRRAMCGFLGCAPGPALGNGGLSVARC
jgi:hypothetical protein